MALTEHQQGVHDGILQAIDQGVKRIKLEGSAGVGKTYLVSELVKACLKRYRGLTFVTAPTNKALAILMKKIEYKSSSLIFKTIHSAMRLVRNINNRTGKATFTPNKWAKGNGDTPNFEQCTVCIIDECSMLNVDFIGGYKEGKLVKGYLEDYPYVTIIFVGDNKQLNPVGEAVSPIWEKDYRKFELTEIIRQGEGNPIIELSRDIDMISFKIPKLVDGNGYIYGDYQPKIISDLSEVNGTDELKYLAWTNNAVDSINSLVRQKIYGVPSRIEPKETLVFNTPFGEFYTNKEVRVDQLSIITDYVLVPRYDTKYFQDGTTNGKFDKIKMKYYRVNDAFNIVHEHSDEIYKSIVMSIKNNCIKFAWSWKNSYFFIEQFADIKYNHALTVHKSQGSTYKETIINIGDISLNKNGEEKQRMLYTAVTRASDLITLNNVR